MKGPVLPLRSPLRRVGWILLLPFLLFGLVDAGRAILQRSPREVLADEFSASFFHENVTVVGLARLDEVVPYEIRTYYGQSFFGQPIKVEPFALIPLNVPERSGNRVLLAEVPLVGDELPADIVNRDRFEFTGLAGPLPSDLRNFIEDDFPPNAVLTRVQLSRGAPRLAVSMAMILSASLLLAWFYWRAAAYEASDDAQEGYPQRVSKFLVTLGLLAPVAVLWKRLQLDPAVDEVGPTAAAMSGLLMMLMLAVMLRGRRIEQHSSEVDPEEEPSFEAEEESPERASG